MGHSKGHCGCFPTGQSYPGIADLLLRVPAPTIGLAAEFDGNTPLRDLPLAVIDTETTGRDPARGDRVVEFAVVYFQNGVVKDGGRHSLLINPGIPIPAEASAVHGISDADVKDKPRFDGVAAQLTELLKGHIPVAYNASFDRNFIHAEMRRAGRTPGPDRSLPPALRTTVEWIDPLVWARGTQSGERTFKLGDVAARLNISLVNAHRATDDAEAAGQVLYALLAASAATVGYREAITRQRQMKSDWERTRGKWAR